MSPSDLADLRARNPVERIAREFGAALRPYRRNFIGSCPLCGGGKLATRFEIKGDKWVCAVCEEGGDVIKLVQAVTGCAFRDAIERLGGARGLSNEERALIDREIAAQDSRRAAERLSDHKKELASIGAIWRRATDDAMNVERYLVGRGLDVPRPLFARAVAALPYFHGQMEDSRGFSVPREVYRGPAMLAEMRDNQGAFCGLHITWIDRDGAGGKAEILDADTGECLPAKKMRGSTKAAHIEITSCVHPARLFLGEGIETVLSVRTALLHTGRLRATDLFWAAGSLGALAGPAAETVPHPTLTLPSGPHQRVPGPVADLTRPAIKIPDDVEELVLLGDGDSDPFITKLALARAAQRHRRPGLKVRAPFADPGRDFNDMLRGAA